MRISWLALALPALVVVSGGAVAPAHAAPKAPAKVAPKPTKGPDLGPLITSLAGADSAAAGKAATTLGESTEPGAHEALLDGLALGLPPPVAIEALAALTKHPAPPDVVALVRYAGHHNPSVRGAALAALAMYPDPVAHAAVVAGLHDMTGSVRGAAATAAAKGHVREAIEPLFELLARGEDIAARGLAAMADADLVRRIGDQFGKVPDPQLAECLGLILRRADFGPDTARVDIVRAIAKIQDQAAVAALTDYLDATPKNPPRESRAEAQKIVEARLGGGK
jgi:HEAT repeat protein